MTSSTAISGSLAPGASMAFRDFRQGDAQSPSTGTGDKP